MEEPRYCIYLHRNKINGKIYIGQTCNKNVRWFPISYKDCSYFYNAIQKYGWDNFEHIILKDNLTVQQVDKLERDYIEEYNSTNRQLGYNLRPGGNHGYNLTKEIKQKISQSNKKYVKEHPEIFQKTLEAAHKANKKAVICLNNNLIFNSQMDAAQYAGLKNSTPISRCCKGERKTAGKHLRTGERLSWKFYDELKENKNNE